MNAKILKVILLCLLLTTVFAVSVSVAEPITWSEDSRLTTSVRNDMLPSVAQIGEGDIWIAWQTNRLSLENPTGDLEIYLKTYNGTWSTPTLLTDNMVKDINPSVAQAANGTVWLVWVSDRTGNNELYFKTSPNYGLSWSDETQLSNDTNNDVSTSIAATGQGEMWVVWQTNRTGNWDIYYKIYNGTSWSNATAVTDSLNSDTQPSVTQTIDGKIWVAWNRLEQEDIEIYYNVFNGSDWTGETHLPITTPDGNYDVEPAVVQDRNGSMWIVWEYREPGLWTYSDLYYVTSDDYGAHWSTTMNLTNTADDVDERWPAIAQGSDKKLWIAWTSYRDELTNEAPEVYYKTSNEISPVHDVAIKSITTNPSVQIYQGENVSIDVQVKNKGDFSESLTVTCNLNSTPLGSQEVTLSAGDSATIGFEWVTSSYAFGPYKISATASSVPGENVINTADNTLIDGTVRVKIPGDIDGDGSVNMTDIAILADTYGSTNNDANWNSEADINRDNVVNAHDLAITGKNYGRSV